MKSFKKIIVLIIAVIILGSSSIAFAWWDNLTIQNAQNNVVSLGEGLELVTLPVIINPLTDGYLIPESAILTDGATHAIELTYTVHLNSNVSDEFNLSVTVDDIKVNDVENPFNLIYVEVSHHPTIANDDVLVALTVRIDDSSLQEENYEAAYTALANQSISFDVHFLIAPII